MGERSERTRAGQMIIAAQPLVPVRIGPELHALARLAVRNRLFAGKAKRRAITAA